MWGGGGRNYFFCLDAEICLTKASVREQVYFQNGKINITKHLLQLAEQ